MLDIESLILRADRLAVRANRSRATVSKWLFNDANTIGRLEAGGSLTVTTLLRATDELRRREAVLDELAEIARREGEAV